MSVKANLIAATDRKLNDA